MSTNNTSSAVDTPVGKEQAGVHPSAVGPDPNTGSKPSETETQARTQTQTGAKDQSNVHANPPNTDSTQQPPGASNADPDGLEEGDKPQDELDKDGYPPQLHAGKVGLGPEYGQKKGDEQTGIAAKITGFKEEIKGKLTRNPDLAHKGHERMTGELAQKAQNKSEQNPFEQGDDAKKEAKEDDPDTKDPNAHPNEKQLGDSAAKEQASTVSPEGTHAAGQQASEGRDLGRDKIAS